MIYCSIYHWLEVSREVYTLPRARNAAKNYYCYTGVYMYFVSFQYENISIFHGFMMWIEKSVTRVTDRHHEACRVMPNSDPEWRIFLSIPYTHDRYFFLHTFWFTTFDFLSRTWYKVTLFPLKSFYSSLKKPTLQATAIRFLTLTSYLHKVTSFFDVTAVKTNVT